VRAVAFVSRKGGSGKSTIATHLAIGAALRGRKVILADTDPQRSAFHVIRMRGDGEPRCEATSGAKLFALKASAERTGYDLLIVDTPAGNDDVITQSLALCDQAIVVVRPSFLDFSVAERTAEITRHLRKPALAILNQAPPLRDGGENTVVKNALQALELMKLPTFPIVVRYRLAYQTALARGLSVEEIPTAGGARTEMSTLADMADRIWFPRPYEIPSAGEVVRTAPPRRHLLHAAE